jgi:glycosyltransferase involved in cell wall biosynthesis
MKIRIIDYVANHGGGIRFSIELFKALEKLSKNYSFEILSTGIALERYKKSILELEKEIKCDFIDFPTDLHYKNFKKKFFNLPGSQHLSPLFGYGSRWHFPVPRKALEGCDIIWFPWAHQHKLPPESNSNITASIHDLILFEFPELISKKFLREEKNLFFDWIDNPNTKVVVSSETTKKIIKRLFNIDSSNLKKVEIAGNHLKKKKHEKLLKKFSFLSDKDYLIYPANTSPHKNHENLIEALGKIEKKIPLVLTGAGTDLKFYTKRGRQLRKFISKNNLILGEDIIPIGYVDDEEYINLLSRSKAIIVPSLSEGGGSFPLYEAMFMGIPAVVSKISVLTEQLNRSSGEVIWFDPLNSDSIKNSIENLIDSYEYYSKIAFTQISKLENRTWNDVGLDYERIFLDNISNEI